MTPIHTIEMLDGSTPANPGSLKMFMASTANVIGGGAGQAVTKVITFSEPMPANYQVILTPDQDAVCFISAKTVNGFTINMSPRLAANTLAVGVVNMLIFA